MLKSNWILKIAALLFAVILWSYVLAETNPPRERVMEDISVRYEDLAAVEEKDLEISGSLSEALDKVDIRVEVNQNQLKYLNDENVRAYVDLSEINGKGDYVLRVRATTTYGRVLSVSPSEVTLLVDHFNSRTIPVAVNVSGSVPEGYFALEPEITPDVVRVEGAMVDVENVASADCSIDLNGLTEGYSKSIEVTLYDVDGNVIDASAFADSIPSVIVDVEVLAKKTVPVSLNGAVLGQDDVAEGYEVTGIEITPDSVEIVGEKALLDTIPFVTLVPTSVSNLDKDLVATLSYQPIEGVQIHGEETAQLVVSIRELIGTEVFEDVPIVVKNAPVLEEPLVITLEPERIDVTVTSGVTKLPVLDKEEIVPYIDLDGLAPGVYNLGLMFEVPEGFMDENFSPETKMVTVRITQP